jgi:hypothetical protein
MSDVPIIDVDGVPFELGSDINGYYIKAKAQRVHVTDSPTAVSFDPPIAPTVDLGVIYQAIKAKLPE